MVKKVKAMFDFKSLDFWDKAFILMLVIVIGLQFLVLNEFKQLPGPIFGGDYYYHYGHMTHIAEGGNVFESSHYKGEYEHYPWFTHLFVVLLSFLPGISLFKTAAVFFPIFVTILSALIVYLLGEKISYSKPFSFLLSFFWITTVIPASSPSSVARVLLAPLLIFVLYKAESKQDMIVAGIFVGIAGIAHLTVFLASFIAIGLLFLARVFSEHVKFEKDKLKIINKSKFLLTIKTQLLFFIPIMVIGTLIALLYLYGPLFFYGGETLNPWQEYASRGVQSLTLGAVFRQIFGIFFEWNTLLNSALSILAILGLYTAVKLKKSGAVFLLFFVGIIGYAHPFITLPLLGTSYGYYSYPITFFPFLRYLLIAFGVYFIHVLVKQNFKVKNVKYIVPLVASIFILAIFTQVTIDKFKNDRWTQIGYSIPESTQALFDISNYVTKNTDVDAVFLSTHGESSFALTALTGRKVVFMRRTHANLYVDANKRIADAAVMLYGNKTSFSKQLAKDYDVEYFYEDFYSAQARQQCLQAWEQLEQVPDASYSCLRTSLDYASYLDENGIEYKKVHARLDPASPVAPTFDLLAIKPTNINNFNLTPLYQGMVASGVAAAVSGVVY